MKVTFIVNGDDVRLDLDGDVALEIVRDLALDVSRNTARPTTDWELRDLWGRAIPDLDGRRLRDYQDDSRFFLTLKVGAGGALLVIGPHIRRKRRYPWTCACAGVVPGAWL